MICRRQGRHSQRETIRYICDFSRCRLNVRLTAYIQPLLRGHKYRVWSLFGSCLWLPKQIQNLFLERFEGRQMVMAFRGVKILKDWRLNHYWNWFKNLFVFYSFFVVFFAFSMKTSHFLRDKAINSFKFPVHKKVVT